ncbi:hypothetical protein SMICM17S_12981 [Streptomyces microflavus]
MRACGFDVLIGAINDHSWAMIGFGALTIFSVSLLTGMFARTLGIAGVVPALEITLMAGGCPRRRHLPLHGPQHLQAPQPLHSERPVRRTQPVPGHCGTRPATPASVRRTGLAASDTQAVRDSGADLLCRPAVLPTRRGTLRHLE